MKIQPIKWHAAIELKVEPLGCFVDYRECGEFIYSIDFILHTQVWAEVSIYDECVCIFTAFQLTTTASPKDEVEIVTPSTCLVCRGVLPPRVLDPNSCTCSPPLFWSGSECVPQTQCPCVEGHMSYEIGETYQTEDCADCICKIGGVPECKPKVCPSCPRGLRRENPKSCSCKCVKCPTDEILCVTSGECIPESSWCDGIQDCPDDEKNCSSEKPQIHVNRTETIGKPKIQWHLM